MVLHFLVVVAFCGHFSLSSAHRATTDLLPELPSPPPVSAEGQREDQEALAFRKEDKWTSVQEWNCELVNEPKWRKLCVQWATMHQKVDAYLEYVAVRTSGLEHTDSMRIVVKPYIARSTDGSKSAQRNADRALEKGKQAAKVPHFHKRWAYVKLHSAMEQIVQVHNVLFEGAQNANKQWRQTIHAHVRAIPAFVLVNKYIITQIEGLLSMYKRENMAQIGAEMEEDFEKLLKTGSTEQEYEFVETMLFMKSAVDKILLLVKAHVERGQGYMLFASAEETDYSKRVEQLLKEAMVRFSDQLTRNKDTLFAGLEQEVETINNVHKLANEYRKSSDDFIDKVEAEEKN